MEDGFFGRPWTDAEPVVGPGVPLSFYVATIGQGWVHKHMRGFRVIIPFIPFIYGLTAIGV